MAEIRVNATGGLKLYDADDSHYAQIVAGTITSNVDAITLGHDTVTIADNLSLGSDSAVLKFGTDGDTTLTHTDGTGLTLNSTNKLCFNDATQYIQGASGTVLDIAATDEIELTSTLVDLNGNLDVSGTTLLPTLGVITAKDLGVGVHIRTADSGASVHANADELIIENNGACGLSILSSTSTNGAIIFGDSGGNARGRLTYEHGTDDFAIDTAGTESMRIEDTGSTTIDSSAGGATKNLTIKNSGSVGGHLGGEGTGGCIVGLGDAAFKFDNANNIFRPFSWDSGGGIDDTHDMGASGHRFDDIYATNGSIQTSDRNEKNTITATDLGLDFINALTPVSYKFNDKTRTHYGLIAQDVETVLTSISKDTEKFAGFIKTEIKTDLEKDLIAINARLDASYRDEEGDELTDEMITKLNARKTKIEAGITAEHRYGLRYNEFISPIVKAIQELSARVTTLEG